MIHTDPVLAAAAALVDPVLSPVPVSVDDVPNSPESVVLEAGTSERPGTMARVAEDLWLRVVIRGIAAGPGARRRALHLAETAADALVGARLSGDGWEVVGWRHVTDAPAIADAGDLVNAVIELEAQTVEGPASGP